MATLKLFDDAEIEQGQISDEGIQALNRDGVQHIWGLQYQPAYITVEEQAELLRRIDTEPWSDEIERRVQHYGYKYNYKIRRIDASMRIGQPPEWLLTFADRLYTEGLFCRPPDQVIVNEYLPGQGIFPHVDCEPCFGETIASLSLSTGCLMDFTHRRTGERIPLYLEPRSLIVLCYDARYIWKHGIAKRQTDVVAGKTIRRGRRVSLTFRLVRQNNLPSAQGSLSR